MRQVDLAVYADELAGEAAALAARIERERGRLRRAALERAARADLDGPTTAVLERAGVLAPIDERAARAELDELVRALEAVETLQAWVEERLGFR